jgi:hypothetical protein
VSIELACEKHAGGLQDLVRATQLRNLFAQRFDLLVLLAAQDVFAPPLVSFGLPDVFAQCLALDPEILATCATGRPDSNIKRVSRSSNSFEYLLACHEPSLLPPPGKPWPRSLRQTQDGSTVLHVGEQLDISGLSAPVVDGEPLGRGRAVVAPSVMTVAYPSGRDR